MTDKNYFAEGGEAFRHWINSEYSDIINPYPDGSPEARDWDIGWEDGLAYYLSHFD